ncbi:MAG TPA: sigma-70 family RNA polymerase sigma factor [Steroidobacteraceae bacterium]|nr:sigma-70 family RNA polymerase sigma factor [Steroidobacteraceae bacterium]
MTAGAETDESLMQRFAAGEAEAFEMLYRRHELRVWRYVERTVRDRAAADDVMQDVWFAVAREAIRYRPTARFTTWLYTMAHNRLVDWLRAARPHAQIAAADEPAPGEEVLADTRPDPLASTQSAEEARALLTAIEQLPEAQRGAFLLQAEGELSVADIAAITGASFETTKSRLRYARARLKQLLWEYA